MVERKYFDYDETKLTPAQAANRRYKQRNKERLLKENREWARKDYRENPERHKKRCQEWRKNNPEKYKESYKKTYAKLYERTKIGFNDRSNRIQSINFRCKQSCSMPGYYDRGSPI